MNGLLRAARYLTIVPLPGGSGAPLTGLGAAAPWFPVIGLLIGILLVAVDRLTTRLFPVLLSALLTVTAWKLLTGGLHLDGLADCLDGLLGRDSGHRLAIMRDSRIGAFGAIGLILFLLLELAAVAELPSPARWETLLAAPAIARAAPPLLARLFPSARTEGMGVVFGRDVAAWAPAVALLLALATAVASLGVAGVVATAVATLAAVALGRFFTTRLGGTTGDVLGAAVEMAELSVLLTVSAWVHTRV
ncbi:MAG TPA: adenosylcobinamide-GDP ribazoletransferase [Methylomirabilota bacterium]